MSGGCCGSPTAPADVDPSLPDQIRTEADLVHVVCTGRGDSAFTRTFLELLDERHAVYRGVASSAVTRMRGALLLALGYRALPAAALQFVLEELESAHDAWLTAVAAHVLRKFPEPLARFTEPLLSAVFSIRHRDEIVRLGEDGGGASNGGTTTAMREVMETIGWLGQTGLPCVSRLEDLLAQSPGPSISAMVANAIDAINRDAGPRLPETLDEDGVEGIPRLVRPRLDFDMASLRFQDHSGAELTFADAFQGHPSIVVFFYTRCDNPSKCPLTMFRFGSLQRLLQQSGYGDSIGLAAITYDPDYDRAGRLLQYAESWGAKPSSIHRILRTVRDFATLSDYFSLGVNFSASGIVNRHQLEAFVLDTEGRIAHAVTRRRWDEAALMRLAVTLRTPAEKS